eukprot:TRINITY_DN50041_c0_g1_i1.p1 TRINITY_DN50041_c0_g1~~TRINITY_DN50041_c0_g1_i1.p1  ORF type:complete len:309 (+),score=69.23 TRINITY_DN50041_c0_g1_i1:128-1054(+)
MPRADGQGDPHGPPPPPPPAPPSAAVAPTAPQAPQNSAQQGRPQPHRLQQQQRPAAGGSSAAPRQDPSGPRKPPSAGGPDPPARSPPAPARKAEPPPGAGRGAQVFLNGTGVVVRPAAPARSVHDAAAQRRHPSGETHFQRLQQQLGMHRGPERATAMNYAPPTDRPRIAPGQFVTVCSAQELQPMVGANWTHHYLDVVDGRRVGFAHRRCNAVLFVIFMDDAGEFPLALSIPSGALTVHTGDAPPKLAAYAQRHTPQPLQLRRTSSSSRERAMQQLQQQRTGRMPMYGPVVGHGHPGDDGSRSCSVM